MDLVGDKARSTLVGQPSLQNNSLSSSLSYRFSYSQSQVYFEIDVMISFVKFLENTYHELMSFQLLTKGKNV